MIVELIGSSGAGKTTMAELVQRYAGPPHPTVLIGDLISDRPGRRWIRHPKALNLLADVTCLPAFLRGRDRSRAFIRYARRRLSRSAPSAFARYNYLREVVRDVGKQELARRVDADAIVLLDEGPLLTAYHLFVYNNAPCTQEDLDRFARLVPLPDRVVYVTAPVDVLVERAIARSDRRRELSSGDRREVERWIARAVAMFDGLVSSPPIRERVLVVDNADDALLARVSAASRLADTLGRSFDERGPAPNGPSAMRER